MENVTVRESACLYARRAESGTAHPQSSTQPGSDPAATATPSTAQPGAALADGLPGTTDITPSHYVAAPPRPTEARPEIALQNADLQTELAELRTKYDHESNLHTRFRKLFDEEIEIREELQLQLEDAKTTAAAEAAWANQNEALLDDMRVLMTCLTTQPATATPPATAPHAPRSKPTRPDPYSGGRTDLRRFRTQLSLAMATTNYFADEQHRLRYCFELLKGDALATMEPYLNPTGHIALTSTSTFLDKLSRVFGDSDVKATAARELEQLRQGKRDFAHY